MAYFDWFVTELVFLPDTVFCHPCGLREDTHEGREGQNRSRRRYKVVRIRTISDSVLSVKSFKSLCDLRGLRGLCVMVFFLSTRAKAGSLRLHSDLP